MNTLQSYDTYVDMVSRLPAVHPTDVPMGRSSRLAWSALGYLAEERGVASLVTDARWYRDRIGQLHMSLLALAESGMTLGSYQGFAVSDGEGRMVAVLDTLTTRSHTTRALFIGRNATEGVLDAHFDQHVQYNATIIQDDIGRSVGDTQIADAEAEAREHRRSFHEVDGLRVASYGTAVAVARGLVSISKGDLWQSSPIAEAARVFAGVPGQPR